MDNFSDIGAVTLANALPQSEIQRLGIVAKFGAEGFGNHGAVAFANALPQSKILELMLVNTGIGDVGAVAFAKALSHSRIQSLNLNQNNIGNDGAFAFAQVLADTKVDVATLLEYLTIDVKRALAKANPNINLEFLSLLFNNISTAGVEAFCRIVPHPNILLILDNPMGNCYISSASSNSPYWVFSIIHGAYRTTMYCISKVYHQVKNNFLSTKLNESNQNIAQDDHTKFNNELSQKNDISNGIYPRFKIGYPINSISYNNNLVIEQTSLLTNLLPKSVSDNSAVPEEFSESATTSDLSLGEKWIAGQFLVGLIKKYSPFTLPWNREHSLTTQEQTTLKHYQRQLQQLAQNFKHQRESRAVAFESVADRFAYIDAHLPKVQQAITKAFKHKKITSAEFQEITTTFNRMQECSQAIVKENQRLRKLEIKEYRQLRRAERAGREQPAFKYSYDVVNQTLKHEVVKESLQASRHAVSRDNEASLPCALDSGIPAGMTPKVKVGLLQQFWSRGDKVNAQPTAIEQAKQENFPKLSK